MRLLLTRPEPDAAETAARLRAVGHAVMVQPMLSITLAPPPDHLPEPVALIATSRNGVRALAAWPTAAAWRRLPLFVTGAASAALARAVGFSDVRPGGADASALADRIAADLAGASGPLLYAAGRDRSGSLEESLKAAGFDLSVIEAYRAEPAARLDPAVAEALRSGRIDGVLVFSARTAEVFAGLLEAAGLAGAMRRVTLYAISAGAAEPLRRLPGADIRVAAAPGFAHLAALVGAEADSAS
jgi:uroporphyrinogen-III synthase